MRCSRLRNAALALAVASGPAGAQQPSELAGLWAGPIEHADRRSTFAVRLVPSGADSLDVLLSLPALGVVDLQVGRSVTTEEGLALGGWRVAYDPGAGTLRGIVPGALVPVHEIPFTLTRAERLDAPEAPAAAPHVVPRWTVTVDAPVWAGVAAHAGVVYVATDAGSVLALSEDDGSVLWTTQVGGAVRATPTLGDGGLFVHADDGRVSRLDAVTGRLLWSESVGEPAVRVPPGEQGSRYDSYASAVLLAGGAAVVGTHDGAVVALDPGSGRLVWRTPTEGSVLGTPTTDGERIYYGSFSGDVGALAPTTGADVWRARTSGAVVSSPTVAGDLLIVGNRAYDLLGLGVADGSVRWRSYVWFSWVESSATVHDGVAFVGSSDARKLFAFDPASGDDLWAFPTEGSTWATPAARGEGIYVGTVGVADYFVDHRARFHAVHAASGRPAWRFEAPRPEGAGIWGFASSPAVGARGVYVGGLDGRVYAFPSAEGH